MVTVVDFKNRDSAVPEGYKASAEEDKTLTCALVSVLESSLRASESGFPLGELKARLREEKNKQGCFKNKSAAFFCTISYF